MPDKYASFFRNATGNGPFPYQARLAASPTMAGLLCVPTGAGKTAAAVLAWLYRRRSASPEVRDATPRRLVYCLPMRVLVEQTVAEVRGWLARLGLDDPQTGVLVDVLMGGDTDAPWDVYPERDAILIGTQDMLLSRALQRGYGMNRYRWPIHFGLVNNDCQWVVDEVQLMDVGLATTGQLQAFRRKLGTLGPVRTLWMSATADPRWLATVDVDLAQDAPAVWPLDASDLADERLERRYRAAKPVHAAAARANAPAELAAEVLAAHPGPGARTLIAVNTVARARTLFDALIKKKPAADLVLIHSRFRPQDRKDAVDKLLAQPGDNGTICVSTQVIEAGVDVSADVLFTELAPWPSLVQRFGRCNRRGEIAQARVLWIDLPADTDGQPDVGKFSLPYEAEAILGARQRILSLPDAAPALLPVFDQPFMHKHVLRRADLLDLFDTTPDLLGNEIDVSRFVRELSDSDVQVFWRTSTAGPGDTDGEALPDRQELCSVPIGEVRDRIKNKLAAFYWDALDGTWTKIQRESELRPGMQVRLEASEGGYSPLHGTPCRALWVPCAARQAGRRAKLAALKQRPPTAPVMAVLLSAAAGGWGGVPLSPSSRWTPENEPLVAKFRASVAQRPSRQKCRVG